MGYIDTTELGKTTMAVKSLAVILFSGLAAAEASYGYGVALHPGYGTSYTNRSPQGLSYGRYGYGGYGKRDAEPGYGYGARSYTYRSPQGLSYGGYGYGGYGGYGYGIGYGARSYTHRSPQGLSYGGYGYGGYGGYGYGKRDAEPGYGYGIGYGLAATAYH